jgi:hypothetical protein
MTEKEWRTAKGPGRMLWFAQKGLGPRKPSLFAAACLRRIWHLHPGPCSRHAVEVLESFADGNATADELAVAREAAREEGLAVDSGGNQDPRIHAATAAAYDDPEYVADFAAEATAWAKAGRPRAASYEEAKAQCALLRDIFNPFRQITIRRSWPTADVLGLARAIYDDRAFDRLPILADALIDAGCDNEDILVHCRSDGPHVRGCWVVDLILGKE